MLRRNVLVLVALLSLLQCTSTADTTQNQVSAISFEVNEGLLSEEVVYHDLGFAMRQPAGWTALDPERLPASESGESLGIQLKAAYVDSGSGSGCTVSTWTIAGDPAWKEAREVYSSWLKEHMSTFKMEADDFLLNGVLVRQFMLRSPETVNFKLVFPQGGQLDFLVPMSHYELQVECVESVFGSIRWLQDEVSKELR